MIVTKDELARLLEDARRSGMTIVFTNGCFDILHLGHLRCLEAAKSHGDILVVGINSDASVRRLKGKGRPIHHQDDRAALLAGLKPVDYVVVFDEDTPVETIKALRPDVHVKGGDYKVEDLPEREAIEGHGGKIVIVPLVKGYSTTSILERLQRGRGKAKRKVRKRTKKA